MVIAITMSRDEYHHGVQRRPLRYRGWSRPRTYADTRLAITTAYPLPTGPGALRGGWPCWLSSPMDIASREVPSPAGSSRTYRSPTRSRTRPCGFCMWRSVCAALVSTTVKRSVNKRSVSLWLATTDCPSHSGPSSFREVVCKSAPSYVASVLGPAGVVLILAAGLDLLWPLWDSENRALHDHIAKTHVLRALTS
jgi:hypothetical protein